MGIEDKIGSRTDLLVANAANSLQKAPSPAETIRPRWLLCFIQPQPGRLLGKSDIERGAGKETRGGKGQLTDKHHSPRLSAYVVAEPVEHILPQGARRKPDQAER